MEIEYVVNHGRAGILLASIGPPTTIPIPTIIPAGLRARAAAVTKTNPPNMLKPLSTSAAFLSFFLTAGVVLSINLTGVEFLFLSLCWVQYR